MDFVGFGLLYGVVCFGNKKLFDVGFFVVEVVFGVVF